MFFFFFCICSFFFFFFNDTATTEIYTLSLHDALPIAWRGPDIGHSVPRVEVLPRIDRKSTRLNSSHDQISYAVFCLKKKKTNQKNKHQQNNQKNKRNHNTITNVK